MKGLIFGIVIGYLMSDMVSKNFPTVAHYKVNPDWLLQYLPNPNINLQPKQDGEGITLRELIQ